MPNSNGYVSEKVFMEFQKAMEDRLGRIDNDLYNHGREGLKTVVTSFISEYRESEKQKVKATDEFRQQRELSEKERDRKIDRFRWWMMWAIAILGAIMALFTFFEGNKQIKAGMLKFRGEQSSIQQQAAVQSVQEASAP